MKNNVKAIVCSIIMRIASEYGLDDIRKVANKNFKEFKQVDDEFETMRKKTIRGGITYGILDLINKVVK